MSPRPPASDTAATLPRRQRMTREVRDYGIEWGILVQVSRLFAAAAAGALLTFWFVGHGNTSARTVIHRQVAPLSAPPSMPSQAADRTAGTTRETDDAPMPELLAPEEEIGNGVAPEGPLPQRDVFSDGGGH